MLNGVKGIPSIINREKQSFETSQAQLGNRRVSVGDSAIPTRSSHQTGLFCGRGVDPQADVSSRRVSVSANFRNFGHSIKNPSDKQGTEPPGSTKSSAISKAILYYFQSVGTKYTPQTSRGITEDMLKKYEHVARDIDYVIYSMPVNEDQKGLRESFLKPLVDNNIIAQDFIPQPLVNRDLQDALKTVDFYPKLDETKKERPGVYFNNFLGSTIEFSERTTKEGDTEWNLFFKGVDPSNLHKTGTNALKNVGKGLLNNLSSSRIASWFPNSSRKSSSTKNAKCDIEAADNISSQEIENENKNIASAMQTDSEKVTDGSQHNAENYRNAEKTLGLFLETAERTCGKNGKRIIITLAGHSMGGGLVQTGLAAYHNKIDRAFTFQAMDTAEKEVAEKIKNNPEIALKMRDLHTKGDLIVGRFKTIRNSRRMKTLSEKNPEIRRTIDSFSNNSITTHRQFIKPVIDSIQKSNPLIFSNQINSNSDSKESG